MGLAWHLLWSSQKFGYEIQIPLQRNSQHPTTQCNHSSRLFADSILTCNSLLLLGCIPNPLLGCFSPYFSLHKHLYILLKVQSSLFLGTSLITIAPSSNHAHFLFWKCIHSTAIILASSYRNSDVIRDGSILIFPHLHLVMDFVGKPTPESQRLRTTEIVLTTC